MTAEVVPAKDWHVGAIALNAREADRVELWASGRTSPSRAMREGMRRCEALTGMVDGEPVCMFGVAPVTLLGGKGVPWMIGSESLEANQVVFLRRCRPHVAAMRARYDVLENWVHDRNEAAQRWLRWLGFKLDEPRPYGVNGELFRRFEWRRGDV